MKNIANFTLVLISLLFTGWGCANSTRIETPANAPTALSQNEDYLRFIQVKLLQAGDDGVYGEVKNTGDKNVVSLTVRAFLLDKNDKPVSEEDHYIIIQNHLNPAATDALKPNYSRKFNFVVDAPTDWSKKVKLAVVEARTLD